MFFRSLSAVAALVVLLLNGPFLNAQQTKQNTVPEARDTITVDANESLPSLRITDKTLSIAGKIQGDVHAADSTVVIRPGGKIEGKLYLRGGSLENQTKEPILIIAESDSHTYFPNSNSGMIVPSSAGAHVPALSANGLETGTVVPFVNTNLVMNDNSELSVSATAPQSRKKWFDGQMALLIFGLLAGAVLRIAAPRAANRASTTIGLQPARCLLVGGASALSLGVVSLLNAGVTNSPIKLLWLPFGFAVATGILVLLAFSWLCGMRALGDVVAAKTGRESEGDFLVRLAIGLSVFFLLNTILGGIGSWLGAMGLVAQLIVCIMGLGAAVITGFGKSENWLGAKMRGRR